MAAFRPLPALALAGGLVLLLITARHIWNSPAWRLERLRQEVASKGGRVFQTTLNGQEMAFLLQDCKLYKLEVSRRSLRRELVLKPDFYPIAFCFKQTIERKGDTLEVYLLMQALGAGGGNQGGGTYRSTDGRTWQ
ncbi:MULTISPECIES: hypothetical protein [unclassified Synechococcus]|uniref:hypothetical protein n=1 Tax=unclassified Synechococcus TaxID=2626047 RepID=UPI00006993F4|nr:MULTISPECIES: hypothetical protein [unclassified Synechococcus]EAQ76283.1 hypothetical protein WH5701_15791 [Synechococcus sp. WH 5701]WFN58974.1 hypothetical protein N4320_14585 [Synechococcus sp. CCFWC 502]